MMMTPRRRRDDVVYTLPINAPAIETLSRVMASAARFEDFFVEDSDESTHCPSVSSENDAAVSVGSGRQLRLLPWVRTFIELACDADVPIIHVRTSEHVSSIGTYYVLRATKKNRTIVIMARPFRPIVLDVDNARNARAPSRKRKRMKEASANATASLSRALCHPFSDDNPRGLEFLSPWMVLPSDVWHARHIFQQLRQQ